MKFASMSYRNKYKKKYQNIISNICTKIYKAKKNGKLLEKIVKGIFEVHMLVMKSISAKKNEPPMKLQLAQ